MPSMSTLIMKSHLASSAVLACIGLLSCSFASASRLPAATGRHSFAAFGHFDDTNATTIDNTSGGSDDTVGPCAADFNDEYDTHLHIAALFMIMGFSFLGTMIPIIGSRFTNFAKITGLPFQCGKLFGAGVIIATSLVHMLAPAVLTLNNPCLPTLFTTDYTSWAGAIALFAALTTHLTQFMASSMIRKSIHHSEHVQHGDSNIIVNTSAGTGKSSDIETGDASTTAANVEADACDNDVNVLAEEHAHHFIFVQEKHVTTYILEMGIATHSIIIGLALGVARGSEFKSLIVALVFHQFFEGLALSAVVLEAKFKTLGTAIVMVVFYTLTTPIGVAIGIALKTSYNASAQTTLLTEGILDALSAGILAYDALVNIIYMHFSQPSIHKMSSRAQGAQFFALWLGAFAMALIGRWA
ncbi:hypothetical protein HDU76_005964 [Blyttiomyces sp. JEL0837]|nr:hypothetical protein HDU76_005964 [Blyttiomyces sp. JEL0837]